MSFEIIDILIITFVLLFALIYIFKRTKNLLTNQETNQCNSCGDKTCTLDDNSKEKQSCQMTDDLK